MEKPQSISVDLEYSVFVKTEGGADAEIRSVTLGRLKAKHLRLLPQDIGKSKKIDPVSMLPLIAAITGLPESTVDEIDMGDLMKIVGAMESFLGLSPYQKTGMK